MLILNTPPARAASSSASSWSAKHWAMCPTARGLHSSTSHLNVSAFWGIGGAHRGCSEVDEGVLGGVQGVFVPETAQVELKSGRV